MGPGATIRTDQARALSKLAAGTTFRVLVSSVNEVGKSAAVEATFTTPGMAGYRLVSGDGSVLALPPRRH